MAGMFNNMNLDPRMQRQALENKFNAARVNLLAVVAFTAINIVMMATGIGGYFLFSATVPYLITTIAMLFCGMLPEEYYAGPEWEGMVFLDKSFFYIALAISLVILALYIVCWFFSKKKPVWLTVALGLFIVDTVVMFLYYGITLDMLLDIAFHAWVIWILVSGIKAKRDLAKLPAEETVIEAEFTDISDEGAASEEPSKENAVEAEENSTESHPEE